MTKNKYGIENYLPDGTTRHLQPEYREITEEDVDEIVSEVDYEFKNYKEYEIDTEICGRNDEGGI